MNQKTNNTAAVLFSILGLLSGYLFPIDSVQASVQSQTFTSQAEWQSGTADTNVEFNQSPGDLSLKQNKDASIETTSDDFKHGYSSLDRVMIDQVGDGELVLAQGYEYATATTPAIPDNSTSCSFIDSARNLLYICTGNGLSVINTQGTTDQSDDILIKTYSSATAPIIGGDEVLYAFLDSARNLIYIGTVSGGLSVINTQGTVDPADDTLVKTYNTGTTPAIGNNFVFHVSLDSVNNLVYVSTLGGGLSAINTQGTVSAADDTLVKTYTTATTPAIGNNDVVHAFFDSAHNLVYVSTFGGGLSVINTQGTVSAADDTLVKTYTTATTPAIGGNFVQHTFLDSARNLLYVGSNEGGLSVINTQGTVSAADDILVNTYTTATTPAIGSNYVKYSFLDLSHNLLYVAAYGSGISVINTQGTVDPADDTLVETYTTETNPSIASTSISHLLIDSTLNLLYVSAENSEKFSVVNLNQEYSSPGVYVSSPKSLSSNPSKSISWDETSIAGQTVSVQTRAGDSTAVWADDFEDNNASNVTDYYEYGYPFNSVQEVGGVLKMTNPADQDTVYMYLDTGKALNYFPAGSVVTAKIRYVGSGAVDVQAAIASDDWESNSSAVNLDSGEWKYVNITAFSPFSIVEIDTYWYGTWNNATDSIEVDWVRIEPSDAVWGEWSAPCTNSYGCLINPATLIGKDWLQYKLNLSTSNIATTPTVNSVTLSSKYNPSGIYTSDIIDAARTSEWKTFITDAVMPIGTSLIFYTRSGPTPDPDGAWSAWQETTGSAINSPNNRYLQFQATLVTTDENKSPVISALVINYDTFNIRIIADPTPEKLEPEFAAGFISIIGEDPTQTESFTFNVDFTLETEGYSVFFPAGTVVTPTQGDVLDLMDLTTENMTNFIQGQLDNVLGAIKVGIPDLNLTFSQPVTITIPVGVENNSKTLQVKYQREGESVWSDDGTCFVVDGNCVFQATHATTFVAEKIPEKAHIDSWKAEQYEKPSAKCIQRLKVFIDGKNFSKKSEVRIGNQEALSVNRKSSKELTANFCLEKLLDKKTGLKRTISVKNPDTDKENADKKIDLADFMGTSDISQGNSGWVKSIQNSLVKLGYLDQQYVTGIYGPLTTEAVKKFQGDNGIEQTGTVGPLTKAKLAEKMN